MIQRRRFLQLCAASAGFGLPVQAAPDWRGQGLGADVSLTLAGHGDRQAVLAALPALLARIEGEFSLYDPQSALSRLNTQGQLHPSPMFEAVMDWALLIWQATDGAFDPTVQTLWESRQTGIPALAAGFDRVRHHDGQITLPPDTRLTFNGIAQGFAADAVASLLARHGFDKALIDMGEARALKGPWQIGIADPRYGILAHRSLTAGAIATSSPLATLINGQPHLMHPRGLPPLWSSVSVEADRAVLADGFSTAAVFFTRSQLAAMMPRLRGMRQITLIDFDGNLTTLSA
ncbi:FAD:protein FMN transferase [Pseudotabrizicola sp. L79]|uniref:FAD:protein FMN transferase n=1 Tax=Pseudotabrizicola sp. L79 TaxID=3118402 RepID=UPI002F93CA1E